MKIPSFLSAVEPTQLLQTVLSTYVQITTPNRGVPYCQTILQGGLLTAVHQRRRVAIGLLLADLFRNG